MDHNYTDSDSTSLVLYSDYTCISSKMKQHGYMFSCSTLWGRADYTLYVCPSGYENNALSIKGLVHTELITSCECLFTA